MGDPQIQGGGWTLTVLRGHSWDAQVQVCEARDLTSLYDLFSPIFAFDRAG